jgi:GDP-L-fucose synthase
MPTNLYGPNDNFDLETSHVLPAMIRKFHDAKQNDHAPVKLWGSGKPMREFLHVDDLASAVLFALENRLDDNLYNVGTGEDLTIKELSKIIQDVVGHRGEVLWDSTKPDGTPRKLMDVSKLKHAGWSYKIDLVQGIHTTYEWFLKNTKTLKEVKLG